MAANICWNSVRSLLGKDFSFILRLAGSTERDEREDRLVKWVRREERGREEVEEVEEEEVDEEEV